MSLMSRGTVKITHHISRIMPWGDIESLLEVKDEIDSILTRQPKDRAPWKIDCQNNAEKIAFLESVIMEMLRGDGGGMTAGARRELLWRDLLCSESTLFTSDTRKLGRDADYAFKSSHFGMQGISHKSVGYNGGILALSWGNNPIPLERIFESPILIVCYKRRIRGTKYDWSEIKHGVYLIPLDYCMGIRHRLGKNNRTDHLIDQELLLEMLNYSKSCDLFSEIPYVHQKGAGFSLSDWNDALGRIEGDPGDNSILDY